MASAENSPRLAQTGDKIDPWDTRKEKCPKAKAGTFGEKTRKPLLLQGFEGVWSDDNYFCGIGTRTDFCPKIVLMSWGNPQAFDILGG
jgi:hypothetical protein